MSPGPSGAPVTPDSMGRAVSKRAASATTKSPSGAEVPYPALRDVTPLANSTDRPYLFFRSSGSGLVACFRRLYVLPFLPVEMTGLCPFLSSWFQLTANKGFRRPPPVSVPKLHPTLYACDFSSVMKFYQVYNVFIFVS